MNPHSAPLPDATRPAACAFTEFFDGVRAAFVEREAVIAQMELALLTREHVLLTGPPGTAKSALAHAVLGRIVDVSGEPSLFSRQLSESAVQTDLLGPVDFKVLTETGRTRYLLDEGMLGHRYAFLDEVFDGRDMLLRAVLNGLHERELKQGAAVREGRLESAFLTSNRYLSEVVARVPELLIAFADRIAFLGFVPRAFARPESRAALLAQATRSQTPRPAGELPHRALAELQERVAAVEVPGAVLEALGALVDALEPLLLDPAQLPDGEVVTRTFSQRSLVKAVWTLKALVVRDSFSAHPERPLRAAVEDLAGLRAFFAVAGPPPEDLARLLEASVDPRERAQLAMVQREHAAFDQALQRARAFAQAAAEREAQALELPRLRDRLARLSASAAPEVLHDFLNGLRDRLLPGPVHAPNREAILAPATALVRQLARRLAEADAPALAGVALQALALCAEVPELASERPALETAAVEGAREARGRLASAAAELDADPPADLELLARRSEAHRALRDAALTLAALPRAGDGTPPVPKGDGSTALVAGLERHAGRLAREAPCPTTEALATELAALSRIEQVRTAFEPSTPPLVAARASLAQSRARSMVAALRESTDRALPVPDRAQALSGNAYARYRERYAGCPDPEASVDRAADGAALPAATVAELREVAHRAALSELAGRVGFLRGWYDLLVSELAGQGELPRREVERRFDALVTSRFPALALKEGELVLLQGALQPLAGEPGELGQRAADLRTELGALADGFGQLSRALLPHAQPRTFKD